MDAETPLEIRHTVLSSYEACCLVLLIVNALSRYVYLSCTARWQQHSINVIEVRKGGLFFTRTQYASLT